MDKNNIMLVISLILLILLAILITIMNPSQENIEIQNNTTEKIGLYKALNDNGTLSDIIYIQENGEFKEWNQSTSD